MLSVAGANDVIEEIVWTDNLWSGMICTLYMTLCCECHMHIHGLHFFVFCFVLGYNFIYKVQSESVTGKPRGACDVTICHTLYTQVSIQAITYGYVNMLTVVMVR